ncbi:MAG: hypothetical protein JWO82_1638, partial [Akkermansiaceae bacterium]|nr:hypothetical protein [Akkermansiaceae bacterium]
PSLENIRFEGDRAWKAGKALRYKSLGEGKAVLGLTHDDPDFVVRSLREQTAQIWKSNTHSKSIPMRGIEAPGLLSISRLALGDNAKIGILDATDGFSRTVGAQRGSGVDIDDVLFGLQSEAAENKLRLELLDLRDSGLADLDSDAGEVAAARLRSSIMPRAQVIVGYQKIGATASAQPRFDEVRRSLVGHIHLEPPMKFADTTQFALKSRIALEAIHSEGMLPVPPGFTPEGILNILRAETELDAPDGEAADPLGGLYPDEVLLLAAESLVSPLDGKRIRIVNSTVHSLTGKKPSKEDRAGLAADTAMRVDRIARKLEEDTAFKGRRSTIQKVLAASTLKPARLSRRPVLEIRNDAIRKLRAQKLNLEDVSHEISPEAAELGVLGLYCLVEGTSQIPGSMRPLLTRSSARVNGEYLPEPQQIIEEMVTSEIGLQQLAQTILDVREDRVPRKLVEGDSAFSGVREDRDLLDGDDLYLYKPGNWSAKKIDTSSDPYVALTLHRQQIVEGVKALQSITTNLKRIESPDGSSLVESDGVALEAEWKILDELAYDFRTWTRTADRVSPSVVPVSNSVDEDADDEEGTDLGDDSSDDNTLFDDGLVSK